eukprot:SM000023S07547  [mRNA]  locus=s23:33263:38154:- [translate_table: standard]
MSGECVKGATDNASHHDAMFGAFPFPPYDIQKGFMQAVYDCLDRGGVGIVESPTGTGKTLSLICSTLQWLLDQQQQSSASEAAKDLVTTGEVVTLEPDWLRDVPSKINYLKPCSLQRKNKIKAKKAAARRGLEMVVEAALPNLEANVHGEQGIHEDELLLDDWDSDSEASKKRSRERLRMVDSASSSEDESNKESKEGVKQLKVFFCSRTHSQLSQFVGELRKTLFAESLQTVALGSRKSLCINEAVRLSGSAAHVNERCLELQKQKDVKKKGDREGLKASKAKKGCPFLSQKGQRKFKKYLLEAPPLDIEELVKVGRQLESCPYYASRQLVPMADLVVLPYQALLHKQTREALDVHVQGSIVVIDEAHNLVDTVASIYSCRLSKLQIMSVQLQLGAYLDRYKDRLASSNRRYIQLLLQILTTLLKCLSSEGGACTMTQTATRIMTINDFTFLCGLDNLNLFKLERYIKDSNIVHKVWLFVSTYGQQQQPQHLQIGEVSYESKSTSMSAFRAFADFLIALVNADSDGRVLCQAAGPETEDPYYKFVMLNAAKHFEEIVQSARAVILAGGTLQPIQDLRDGLFPSIDHKHLQVYSCGHIVPASSILPLAIPKGPTGKELNFSFKLRSSQTMVWKLTSPAYIEGHDLNGQIEELGRIMCNICTLVPDGVVCFFPSFAYESEVHDTWHASGMMKRIEEKKTVFREPRCSTDVDKVLQQYRDCINTLQHRQSGQLSSQDAASCKAGACLERAGSAPIGEERLSQGRPGNPRQQRGRRSGGALLLCVVGGKMSEGINFSDGMGRCVVMVGLPYPSPSDPELLERMHYLDQRPITENAHNTAKGAAQVNILRRCGQRGQAYYENLCMKAVNQSVGRAIRHVGDYAAIILLDTRYNLSSQGGPLTKLPGWIREQLICCTRGFGDVPRLLHQFFQDKG